MYQKFFWLAVPVSGLALVGIIACNAAPDSGSSLPTQGVKVVAEYPHDPAAFSQGLAVEGPVLYEGTGKYGPSALRKIVLETGAIEQQVPLGPKYFGEGITVFGNRIYQLTWKERVCIVYDKDSLKPLGSLAYTGEGWGLADDEKQIYMSDGTSTIRVLDPQTFKVLKRLSVKNERRRLDKLNELEFVNGELWANIWYSDTIARIDPETGAVKGWVDCSSVYPMRQRPDREHVFNGIAVDEESGRLFVTGKNWPKLFEIELLPMP